MYMYAYRERQRVRESCKIFTVYMLQQITIPASGTTLYFEDSNS